MGGLPWLRRRSALLGGRGEEWGTRGASSGAHQPEQVGWGAEAAAELGDRTADPWGCLIRSQGLNRDHRGVVGVAPRASRETGVARCPPRRQDKKTPQATRDGEG